MKITVGILHYGDKKILNETVSRASKIARDILVVRLDLFEDTYGDYVLPWDFILNNGYAEVWNFLFKHSPQEYMYILGTGKYIEKIDYSNFTNDFDTFACVNPSAPNQVWYKLGNTKTCIWKGKVHEEICYTNIKQQKKHTVFWDRFKKEGYADGISGVYRWFTRAKWLYHVQVLQIDREGINQGWWTKPHLQLPKSIIDLYLQEKWILESKDTFLKEAERVWGLVRAKLV